MRRAIGLCSGALIVFATTASAAPNVELVKDNWRGPDVSYPRAVNDVGGTLYFRANDGRHGNEIWRSDGTKAGTVMVKDIWRGLDRSVYPEGLTDVEGTLYFNADDGTHGYELWRSDGTEAETVMVKDIWPGSDQADPHGLRDVGGTLYFSADDGIH